MEIALVSRHTEVPDRFRQHVEEKMAKVPQLSPYVQRVEVEVSREHNPKLADRSERVELTVRAKGPVVRAEAAASDRYAALDLATSKLMERLRRARDRHKSHRRRAARFPEAQPIGPDSDASSTETQAQAEEQERPTPPTEPGVAVEAQLGDSPVLIRQKTHVTEPMTVDQALSEMELVGHPFFLFVDSETMQPCVVYNRRGWTYGVIRLDYTAQSNSTGSAEQADLSA